MVTAPALPFPYLIGTGDTFPVSGRHADAGFQQVFIPRDVTAWLFQNNRMQLFRDPKSISIPEVRAETRPN